MTKKFLLAFLLLPLMADMAIAANGPTSQKGDPYAIGAPCTRRTDKYPGEIKIDACKRVYCGRKDVKDIIEIIPNFARINKCTWRLVGEMCKCRF